MLALAIFLLFIFGLAGGVLYYLNISNKVESTLNREKNKQNTTAVKNIKSPTPSPEISPVPNDWLYKRSNLCHLSLRLPPQKEPYTIASDPNTPPTESQDEGKFFVYEEYNSKLLMFDHLARVIFKNPEQPGSGYVSGSVEVFCSPNDEGYTTDSLFDKIKSDLSDNFSVVKIQESIDLPLWNRYVKIVQFSGGTFGEEKYYLFATDTTIYIVRNITMSENTMIRETVETIFQNLKIIEQ